MVHNQSIRSETRGDLGTLTKAGVLRGFYLADAEADPMPKMLVPTDWPAIKSYFEQEVLKL